MIPDINYIMQKLSLNLKMVPLCKELIQQVFRENKWSRIGLNSNR